ncbi:MAG: hypothetical protein H0T85_01370 [Geodermatophilaceae bacterium]|nr:hypothetical protein [Geodermatophilaceae bacterium]
MTEPRFDDDDMAVRLSALGRASELTDGPGLADVHRRRDRRQRRLGVTAGTATLAVFAAVAIVLVQPFGGPNAIAPAGPPGQVTTTTPTRTTTVAAPSFVLAADSSVTRADLAAAGVPVGSSDLGDPDGQPTLPPLCAADSWQQAYSDPGSFLSSSFSIDGGMLAVDLLSYDGDVAANAALVKLKDDARACPVVNEFTGVEVTAVGSAIGDEFVIFRLDTESGQDGSISPIWVAIARAGNVLVSAAVSQDEAQEAQDNQQVSRDAAQAGVDHLLAG